MLRTQHSLQLCTPAHFWDLTAARTHARTRRCALQRQTYCWLHARVVLRAAIGNETEPLLLSGAILPTACWRLLRSLSCVR